ncbi:hypothetical protein AALO_G00088410 [Alosa alosa]|uniref:Uncharacterized protein n=1 Tax=Alosa alosa TaxID=278164 RepID=A0AAV6H349_9TELE|nr:uncharacterized protein LOC125296596 [Alosa alosa]KAG5280377.1 hypothetical protein AALO_G00088410 [Alosa alosa]
METPNPKCARTDSYGCVAWQPQQLPQGETRASLLEKKRELLSIFSHEGSRAANQRRVAELMSETYISQRSDINGFPPPSVSDIQTNWPFLLMPSFLLQHFKTLTEIELEKRLQEALKTKGKRLLNFFKSQLMKWSASVKTVLSSLEAQTETINPGLASILVLMAQFKDQEDAIFLLADETATKADVEAQMTLPSTPRLIMLGDSILGAKKWMLSVEGKVLLHSELDFPTALAVFFGLFYVLNMEYPVEAATTLEFIQRFFVRINPENSKCAAKYMKSKTTGKTVQKKNHPLNPHVASLISSFIDFDWQND